MLLILAIEPDRRQSSRLSALARSLDGASLVVADSIDHAIASLAGRVPDLILTSLLLSPKEEGRLDELNGGAPAQTLVIPVLASPGQHPGEPSGLLTRRLVKEDARHTQGCDPAVFAAQVIQYLERIRSERELETDDAEEAAKLAEEAANLLDAPTDVEWDEVDLEEGGDEAASAPIELSSELVDLESFVAELEALNAAEAIAEAQEETVELTVEPAEQFEAPEAEPEQPVTRSPSVVVAHALSAGPSWPALAIPEIPDTSRKANAERDAVIDDFISALEEAAPLDEPADQLDPGQLEIEEEPVVDADPDGDLWMPLPAAAQSHWPPMFGFTLASQPSRQPTESSFQPAHLALQPAQPPAQAPVQDEWGIYDPDRCGLRAVRARLDEIAR